MRSVKLDLEQQVIVANSELNGTVYLHNVGQIDELVLQLRSGNEQVLLSKQLSLGKGNQAIPFSLLVPFSVLPGSIQNTVGSMVVQVHVAAKTKTTMVQRLRSKMQDTRYITVQNTAFKASSDKSKMHCIDLETTVPEKDDISESSGLDSDGQIKVKSQWCCLGFLFNQKKNKKQAKEVGTTISTSSTSSRRLPKGVRYGYKTSFNTFVFPELCDFNVRYDKDDKHFMSI